MIDKERLVQTFLTLVRIDSPSGHEQDIGEHLLRQLRTWTPHVERDDAGNVIAHLEGTKSGPAILLNAHMDTVGTDRGIVPVIRDGVIYSEGETILGADDKSGLAIILEVLQTLADHPDIPRPRLDVVFTVGEERGLEGARALDMTRLRAQRGVVLDSGGPIGTIIVAAPYQDQHHFVVHGRASHAGAEPEKGINAIQVAAHAIARMRMGRIDEETTANVGRIEGGVATNIVPARVEVHAEARSRTESKLVAQTEHMKQAFEDAAKAFGATVEAHIRRLYNGYRHPVDSPLVRWVADAARRLGIEPRYREAGGGTDANVFNERGLPAVVISTGQTAVHTPNEHIAIQDLYDGARWVLEIVRSA